MRHFLANLAFYLLCRWFGHSRKLVWRPIYRAWHDPAQGVWSGQCSRCWRVVDERSTVVLKARKIE